MTLLALAALCALIGVILICIGILAGIGAPTNSGAAVVVFAGPGFAALAVAAIVVIAAGLQWLWEVL